MPSGVFGLVAGDWLLALDECHEAIVGNEAGSFHLARIPGSTSDQSRTWPTNPTEIIVPILEEKVAQ